MDKYKGYTIITTTEGIFIEHPTLDLGDPFDDSVCPNLESAKQWIDEDIRCRAEEQ